MENPIVIAEIGCVHGGMIRRAEKLIDLAYSSGATYAKFQKRNPIESTPLSMQDKPHPNKLFAYGNTYLEHRQNLEFTIEQHAYLKSYCESLGIKYSTSVWDLTSAKEVIELNPDYIKIPSAQNTNIELIKYLYANYDGQIHISFGMLNRDESIELRSLIYELGLHRTVAYHCTSAYPCPFENLYLLELNWFESSFTQVGFSNHGYGIAADIAALTLGARYFERHFVDDRTFPHTDASASLEPEGMRKLIRDLSNVNKAFSCKPKEIDTLEAEQKQKLKNN